MKQTPAGVKDVARLAGVSLGTVSHVLNHPERVTPALTQRVLAAMDELKFVRNGAASQLRAGRRTAFGLVVPDIANPFFAEVARGAEDEADLQGYGVLICNSGESIARQERHLQFLMEERVSGVLLTSVDDRDTDRFIEPFTDRGIAVVLVDEVTADGQRCSVAVDDLRGGELAGQHLLAIGARRIAFVGGPDWVRQSNDRLSGLQRALDGTDGAEAMRIGVPALNWQSGYGAVDELLRLKPDAVFCTNDLLALGVLRGLVERKVSVPGDVAIVGYDDIEFASGAAVSLTSIRQPAYQIGKTAAGLLLDELRSPEAHAHQQVLFRPELIERESTNGTPKPKRHAAKR